MLHRDEALRNVPKCNGSKGQEPACRQAGIQGSSCKEPRLLACDRSWVARVEVIPKPAAVPVPRPAAPAQAPDVQVAIGAAIDRTPEESVLLFPLFRDQLGVLEQVVKDIGVENRLVLQLLAEFVALDALFALLFWGEVELDLCKIPLKASVLAVALHLPSIGDVGVGVAVDDVLGDGDVAEATNNRQQFGGKIAFAQPLDVSGRPLSTPESELQFICLADVEHQFIHCPSPLSEQHCSM